jgi:hypothetical protein
MSARAWWYIDRAKSQNETQKADKQEKITDFPAALEVSPERFNEFLIYCQNIADILAGSWKITVICKDLWPTTAATFSHSNKSIIRNIRNLLQYKSLFGTFNEPNSQFNREIIDTMTHELSHYEEWEIHNHKRSTHEKDLETGSSFESIQRKLITKLLRYFHSELN